MRPLTSPPLERSVSGVGSAGGAAGRLRRAVPEPLRRTAKRGLRAANRKGDGYTPLDPALRRELTRGFREDIAYLAKRIRPSFAGWLEDPL